MTKSAVSVLATAYVGLSLYFLARFFCHMMAAAADRKNKSILGTVDPFARYSKENYSAEGWQHLVKSHTNALYFFLMIGVPILLKGIASLPISW